MKVTLSGPDDLGRWVLHNENGLAYPLVERHEDHIAAAKLFGWSPPKGVSDQEKLVQSALKWLRSRIGAEITAPPHVVLFFREWEGDEG
ncbi:MAG TPA: hypothetical protein VH592_10585 [Gemmataceae bacterium]|jgi:hypothetical protein